MLSVAGSTRRPSSATSPLTVTRPSAMRSSLARRLATPAAARTFWSLSVDPEGMLERLHHLGSGDEVAQRGQVGQRVEPQLLQEHRRGAVKEGLARPRVTGDLLDVAPLLECAHDAVDVHPPDGGDLGPGDRLLVGDDGQRLEGGG